MSQLYINYEICAIMNDVLCIIKQGSGMPQKKIEKVKENLPIHLQITSKFHYNTGISRFVFTKNNNSYSS